MINYLKFMKSAEAITSKTTISRPILKGVYHSDEGNLYVTDAHVGIRAKGVNAPKNTIIDPKTGKEIDGNYPNLENIFQKSEDSLEDSQAFSFSLDELLDITKAMQYGNGLKPTERRQATFIIEDDVMRLHNKDNKNIDFRYKLPTQSEHKIAFNSEYLLNVLELMQEQNATNVTLHLAHSTKPIYIRCNLVDIDAVIMPLRLDRL